MKLTGNGINGSNPNTEGSIGFNIQNGRMTNVTSDTNKKVEITGMLDVDVVSNNNELYKNNSYIKELKISNGSGLSSTGTADPNAMIGSYNNGYGLIDVDGDRNIVFSNLGFVKTGSVDLNAITIDGNNNAVAYFAGSNVDFRNAGTGNEGKIGYFGTSDSDVIKLQGSIGGNGTSNANVGVYAVSGQRKGLGIAYKHPLYVIGFNGERNEVIVGPNERLFTNRMICKFYNFLDDTIHKELKAEGKIRYAANPSPCTARILDDDTMEVIFEEPQRAITPGQSVAFYNGTQLLGGAVIDRVC